MIVLRASLLHLNETSDLGNGVQLEYLEDAAIVVDRDGIIVDKGESLSLLKKWPNIDVRDFRPFLMVPGLIDTHVHFPQMDMIGACAPSLLPWLETYTYPEEIRYKGRNPHTEQQARTFTRELARQGTSLALVYSSSDALATEQLFEAFERSGLRAIVGKTSMNQHGPIELLVSTREDLRSTLELIGKWHGKAGRLFYALTPRFAPSCSADLLEGLADLRRSDPTLYVQTHYAENKAELDWVHELYPKARDYLDVYEQFDLLGSRSILAHCIHTSVRERTRLRELEVLVSHCPSSNLFLGSGLMPFLDYSRRGIALSLGTDVAAGTSFSLWQTMSEAYKVAQILGVGVSPLQIFYAATLGAARALQMPQLGSLEKGFKADLQILDVNAKESLSRRWARCADAESRLSALIFGVDDRNIRNLFVSGQEIDLGRAPSA